MHPAIWNIYIAHKAIDEEIKRSEIHFESQIRTRNCVRFVWFSNHFDSISGLLNLITTHLNRIFNDYPRSRRNKKKSKYMKLAVPKSNTYISIDITNYVPQYT